MTCAELETLLCDYVDGTLGAGQRAAVEEHLADCAVCAELARDAAAAVTFLKQAEEVEPPDHLVTRLLFQVPSQRQRSRARGLRELVRGWVQPILQPRFAMGMAMTILSFSLLGKFIGVPDRPLRPADLHPVKVWQTVDDRMHRAWDGVIRYYENLRVVYEIQSRLSEWTEAEETKPAQNTPVPPEEFEDLSDRPNQTQPSEGGGRSVLE